MKRLYISDLDGTLLAPNAELSAYTTDALRKFAAAGIKFTVATARTAATVVQMLKKVPVPVTAVLMNGVCLYDLDAEKYVMIEYIERIALDVMFSVLKKYSLSGFLYTIHKNRLFTYYENTDAPNAIKFIREREIKYGKKFQKVADFSKKTEEGAVYYSVSDTYEKLSEAAAELKKCPFLHVEFYRDVYEVDFYYLEICSARASKRNAVNTIRNLYNFDEIIGFGDNLNDLPLFDACDRCYAVANARAEVQERADGMIRANAEDGVVRFIADETGILL